MTVSPQISLYEKVVEDDALEKALEARQKLADSRKDHNKRFREADTKAKLLLEGLELGDNAPVRVGRFVVTRKRVSSREVAFTAEATSRLQISLIPDD